MFMAPVLSDLRHFHLLGAHWTRKH